jgi:hypothetical protein
VRWPSNLTVVALAVPTIACGMPRDAEGTLDRVRSTEG